MSGNATATTGVKPRLTRRGAARAIGVPNPAAPSMNDAKNQAMMMASKVLSEDRLINPVRMASIAPERC